MNPFLALRQNQQNSYKVYYFMMSRFLAHFRFDPALSPFILFR